MDIKCAFRIIPVHPLKYLLLGIKWANEYYFDCCLAMGLKSSCAIFDKFSSSLEWLAMQHLIVSSVLHILDDFLFIAPSRVKCSKFLDMCNFLGVPIAQDKTVGPNTTLQFAGIELGSVQQEARLPLDKFIKCRTLLHHFHKKRSITLRELQSLISLYVFFPCFQNYNYVTKVRAREKMQSTHIINNKINEVEEGRRRVELTECVKSGDKKDELTKHATSCTDHRSHRLTRESKHYIHIWLKFLDSFNGRAFFLLDRWKTSSTLELYTDAAASIVMVRYLENIGLAALFQMRGTVSTLLSSSFFPLF